MLHEYELVLIIRPDLDDADTNEAIARTRGHIEEQEGQLIEEDDWGKRKLAYPIMKHQKGHYVLFAAALDPAHIIEISRRLRFDESVIRFNFVKIAEAVDVEIRRAEAAEKRKAREAARAAGDHTDDDTSEITSENLD
jgi:small subunit ribosomal protein S6